MAITQPMEKPPCEDKLVGDLNITLEEGLEDPLLGTYFVTEQRQSLSKRLHRFGECPVKPSERQLVEAFSDDLPEATAHNANAATASSIHSVRSRLHPLAHLLSCEPTCASLTRTNFVIPGVGQRRKSKRQVPESVQVLSCDDRDAYTS